MIEGDGLLEPGMGFRNAVSHTGERQAWGGKGIGGEFKQEILRRLEVDGPLKVYNNLCDKYGQSGTDIDPEKYARIPDEKTIADTGAYHSSSGKNLSNGTEIKNLAEMRVFTHDKMLATKARVESRSYDRTVVRSYGRMFVRSHGLTVVRSLSCGLLVNAGRFGIATEQQLFLIYLTVVCRPAPTQAEFDALGEADNNTLLVLATYSQKVTLVEGFYDKATKQTTTVKTDKEALAFVAMTRMQLLVLRAVFLSGMLISFSADGTYRLHAGGWTLADVGTHDAVWSKHKYSHMFFSARIHVCTCRVL